MTILNIGSEFLEGEFEYEFDFSNYIVIEKYKRRGLSSSKEYEKIYHFDNFGHIKKVEIPGDWKVVSPVDSLSGQGYVFSYYCENKYNEKDQIISSYYYREDNNGNFRRDKYNYNDENIISSINIHFPDLNIELDYNFDQEVLRSIDHYYFFNDQKIYVKKNEYQY